MEHTRNMQNKTEIEKARTHKRIMTTMENNVGETCGEKDTLPVQIKRSGIK